MLETMSRSITKRYKLTENMLRRNKWRLLACFKVAETTHSLCIVRELAEIEAMDDQPLHNELC